jgi:hypothetical protein
VRGLSLVVAFAAASATASAAEAPPGCGEAAVDEALLPRLHRGEVLDVHHAAVTLDVLCPRDAARDLRRVADALALLELDEPLRARTQLFEVARDGGERARRWAAVALAWAFLRDGDRAAFEARVATAPPEARVRLTLLASADDAPAFARGLDGLAAADRAPVAALGETYRRARRTKRPWLAGLLSAVVPGAGQAYAGSWSAAGVSLLLNGVFIGATVELATRRLFLPAAATGLAASFFYTGNIVNAVDLADKRNERASAAPYLDLERRLVPEARP